MLNSANMSFALCPLLTDGAIEALMTAGAPEQQALYIPKMVSGEWTGTMNLTEPQAGSDLAKVRTRAEPQGDGSYKIFGTKIYITYGEHDMAANICHLVLARVTGAPEGVKGISLFIVPKFKVKPMAAWVRATMCTVSALNTSWASKPAQRRCCNLAIMGER
jgi:3-(methylthio)propanoyl-CoA dehydrogenase